ncbi:hypothetical protein SZ64_11205 [Erythrobacter sp. SG61-1L]|uniref:hypothetical protein n=1 Tax=Erythrobacter sp. SG61-1L TaxID=1603897 RepID=UPI0006C8FA97|nr:hypothetical protein [Erythrobacter sp. SG61-1L]KPL68618.1 hypothetical protein SZ64_11205 [Erythrobacter sp. SG61-1L]
MKNIHRSLVIGCSLLALSACGPDDLGSPGVNGDINTGPINVGGSPTPTPTGATGVTPAADCPTLAGGDNLLNNGTITGPTGTYRVCTLPSLFTADATLPAVSGVVYEINGRVDVGRDDGPTADNSDSVTGTKVNLTIQKGAILYGAAGVSGGSYMIVNRGSKLTAVGERASPIIFTAEADVKGEAQDDTSALWGGIVLLGRAPVADCFAGGINQADQTKCEMRVEGIANNIPFFGGNTPADSSGNLQYIQIRYSGFTLELGSELQSLTLGGVGSGTTLDYIQSYNSSDDGVEFFGGHPNVKHFVAVGAEDDSFDVDSGAQLDLQFALAVQRDNVGDKALENDSPPDDKGPGTTIPDAMPRTMTRISNFTFWATSTGKAIEARGAGDFTLANGVIYKPAASTQSCTNDNGNTGGGRGALVKFYSVELDCAANSATNTAVANGSGNSFAVNTLTGKYLNGDKEMTFTPIYDATAGFSSFFTAAAYVGAVARPAGADLAWTKGWTCDSTTVSFGSGVSCKSLPVY